MTKEELDRRWLQFKRFGEAKVLEIHAAEREAGCLFTEAGPCPALELVTRFNRELGPFWDKRKTPDHCAKETAAFLAFVKPIAAATYKKSLDDGLKTGPALHAADLAVLRADYTLNFGPGSPVAGSKILSQVYPKGGQDRAAGPEEDIAEPIPSEEPQGD